MLRVVHEKSGLCLAARVEEATTFFRRGLGLLGRSGLAAEEGLWLAPCRSIHTHFMRFPIDVLFLDARHQVVGLYEALRPWRITRSYRQAVGALELSAGAARRCGVALGDRLALKAAERDGHA